MVPTEEEQQFIGLLESGLTETFGDAGFYGVTDDLDFLGTSSQFLDMTMTASNSTPRIGKRGVKRMLQTYYTLCITIAGL